MNTLEDNKLIAEFMGLKLSTERDIDLYGSRNTITENDLSYRTSWEWLMPVVSKINSIAQEQEKAREYFEQNKSYDYMMYVAGDVVVTSGITDVFPEVVEFIKWYNENK